MINGALSDNDNDNNNDDEDDDDSTKDDDHIVAINKKSKKSIEIDQIAIFYVFSKHYVTKLLLRILILLMMLS